MAVVDLPEFRRRGPQGLGGVGLADRATPVAGSLFDPLHWEPGATFSLSAIIHKCDDEAARRVRLRTVPIADRGPQLVPARPGGAPQVADGAHELHQTAGLGVHPN